MRDFYIGIDCGLSGAIALINNNGLGSFINEMPVKKLGKGRWYDHKKIYEMLESFENCNVFVHVEDVGKHAPSASGLASMRDGYSTVITCLEILGFPYTTSLSIKWQREYWNKPKMAKGQKFDTKAMSIATAKNLFPSVDLRRTKRSKKDDDGFSDALLIAEYARRKNF